MATYLGRGTGLGFGKESAWGTAVARANWHEAVSTQMADKLTVVPRPHLVPSATSAMAKATHVSNRESGGSLEVLMRYRGMGLPLEAAMGTVATTGTGPYVHTFTLGDPRTLPSLTTEVIRGTSGNSEVFEGCSLSRFILALATGDIMRFRTDVIAETASARGSAGSPTYGDDVPVLYDHAGQFAWNSVNYDLVSMELTVDNRLARRAYIGSRLTKQARPTDIREAVLRVTIEVEDALYAAHLAQTASDGAITFTGQGNDAMTISIQNAIIRSVSDPITVHGIIQQTVEFLLLSDGSNEGLSIAVTNDDATYSAN